MEKISEATLRNFKKLNKNINEHEFISRANKRDSRKHILPVEYFSCKNNRDQIEKIIDLIHSVENITIDQIVDSLVLSYLIHFKLVKRINGEYAFFNNYIREFCMHLNPCEDLIDIEWPCDERDPIGIVYQYLMTEGEKNKKGSYYTPNNVVAKLVEGIKIGEKTVCDPCCGSGSFLIYLISNGIANPTSVYGYDIDENAVKISKANLFVLNNDVDYNQHIFCQDYLKADCIKYDYFITNPPWGSMTNAADYSFIKEVLSGESFSYFIAKCLKSLGCGNLIFLLPVSFLNVRVHSDIRSFILSNYSLNKVFLFNKCFKGVLTDVVGVNISQNNKESKEYEIVKGDESFNLDLSTIKPEHFYVIPFFDEISGSIIGKIQSDGKYNLKDADFALGIVTGNNKELLLPKYVNGSRPIITGKEVNPLFVLEPRNYIFYDREKFQQVCDDKYFAASSKLIYKFISKKLCFACDKASMLTLNSANILLTPNDFYLSDVCLAAILCSAPINFYFINKINQIKILKEDIKNLPLPNLSIKEISLLEQISNESFDSKRDRIKEIDEILYSHYNFSSNEIAKIEESIYGRTN